MTGCTQISAGCDHCYALTLAMTKTREVYLRRMPVKNTPENQANPFAPRFWEDRLDQPLKWKTPMRIFVNSMSDVFHAHFSLGQIESVFSVMNRASWHQFQVLTKRPERALRLADRLVWTPNIWIGASVENMNVARRVDALRQVPAAIHFLSCEPLLGPVHELDLRHIEWVIGGGESGIGYRPFEIEWARKLRDKCLAERIAFFWKQNGGRTPKAGGCELDGETWSQYPTPAPTIASSRGEERQAALNLT